jgi:hypothetical protein
MSMAMTEGIDGEPLDWAPSGFSGFIAVVELYDGPFCILSIVDTRNCKRLTHRVLDHDPTHADITEFFRRAAPWPSGTASRHRQLPHDNGGRAERRPPRIRPAHRAEDLGRP